MSHLHLKFYDCCPFSDGASAVILCDEAFAKKSGKPYMEVLVPVEVHHLLQFNQKRYYHYSKYVEAANQAYKMANLSPKDIDFVEVHDCFTIAELIDIEDLGFFPKGLPLRPLERDALH